MEYYKNLDLANIKYFCEIDRIDKLEEWKDITGFENMYQISNLGRVKSLSRNIFRQGNFYLSNTKILRQTLNKKGYPLLGMSKDNNKTTRTAHVLVAMMFFNYKGYDGSHVIDHIDNVRTNNMATNLQIFTHRQNSTKHIKPTVSKYTGVFKGKENKKFSAGICINKKNIHLGYFDEEIEASNAYQKALINWTTKKIIPENRKRSSKYKNIFFEKKKNKWRAYKIINNKRTHVGYFSTEEEAYKAICTQPPKMMLK